MQIMITAGSLARTRVLRFNRVQLLGALALLTVVLMLLSGAIYHFVFLKAVRDGWPVVSQVVRLIVRDEIAQRDRFVRENLQAMAQKVGEIQAKLVRLEAVGERVAGMAGVRPEELRVPTVSPGTASPVAPRSAGQGGPFIPAPSVPSFEHLDALVGRIDEVADHQSDLFVLFESRLLERRLQGLLIPSTRPVTDGSTGSGFGFRTDPFTGRPALHMGLDFPADVGTPILAAAGGVVLSTDYHAAYGNLVEVDHGRGLVTRYAHASKVHVKAGDIVKRGQTIAAVGNTGRSTGPHLHFEVLVDGVPQDPAKFLAGSAASLGARTAAAARDAPAARESPAGGRASAPALGGPETPVRPSAGARSEAARAAAAAAQPRPAAAAEQPSPAAAAAQPTPAAAPALVRPAVAEPAPVTRDERPQPSMTDPER